MHHHRDRVTDCPGNAIGSPNSATFALPDAVGEGDVAINEVLYDPLSGGSDFVELYNRSQKVLSLANWQLANVDDGAIANATPITTDAVLLMPGAYLPITEDAAGTSAAYPLGLHRPLPGSHPAELQQRHVDRGTAFTRQRHAGPLHV